MLKFKHSHLFVFSPVRIDFCHGGGSDLPQISSARGGNVINMAVSINGTYVESYLKIIPEKVIQIHSLDNAMSTTISTLEQLINLDCGNDDLNLHKVCISVSNLLDMSSRSTLHNQLNNLGGGFELSTRTNLPIGSGLGVSGILESVIITSLFRIIGKNINPIEVVSKSCEVERMLGSGGGWQDPIGGIFGGIKDINSIPDDKFNLDIANIDLSTNAFQELQNRIVLCYTGKSHFSGNVINRIVSDFISKREPQFSYRIKLEQYSEMIRNALNNGDVERLGQLLKQSWIDFEKLVPEAASPLLTKVFEATSNYIDGGKACGAGGGGSMILIAKKNQRNNVITILRDLFKNEVFKNALVFDSTIDFNGIQYKIL